MSDYLCLGHGRSCKTFSHPVDSKEKNEEALRKIQVKNISEQQKSEKEKNHTCALKRSGPVPTVRVLPP